jgi:hypothetical protein
LRQALPPSDVELGEDVIEQQDWLSTVAASRFAAAKRSPARRPRLTMAGVAARRQWSQA